MASRILLTLALLLLSPTLAQAATPALATLLIGALVLGARRATVR